LKSRKFDAGESVAKRRMQPGIFVAQQFWTYVTAHTKPEIFQQARVFYSQHVEAMGRPFEECPVRRNNLNVQPPQLSERDAAFTDFDWDAPQFSLLD
jgi:hypothetical protein